MAVITDTQWGRIYAYLWWMFRFHNGDDPDGLGHDGAWLRNEFETNPASAVDEIVEVLNRVYSAGIDTTDLMLFEIVKPPRTMPDNDKLRDIAAGNDPRYRLMPRLSC